MMTDFKSSGDNVLDKEITLWLKWDKNEKSRLAIKELVDKNDFESLKKLLLNRMEFGTAGLRARMGPGNAQMNDLTIIQTTQGLVKYLQSAQPDVGDKGVVVGFDGRYNSNHWSKIVATILVNAKIKVYLFSKMCPTPYVAFGVRAVKAACGIVITASHNPKEDNGYKVYWDNGAQIISPHDKGISQGILDSLEPEESSWNIKILDASKELIFDPLDETIRRYNDASLSLCYLRKEDNMCKCMIM
ncbi:Phosphoglucomutase-2 [Bulinus truncatus]|nr:Phosphoglucomutase-2 [Bulinus truncatus]